MAGNKLKRTRNINTLYKYIDNLRKNEEKNEINDRFLKQFCRFAVISNDISIEITENIDTMPADLLNKKLATYKTIIGMALQLYNTLGLKNLNNEIENGENPYLVLMREEANDG